MNRYHWTEKLGALYRKALDSYHAGCRDASALFSPEETDELSSIGLKPINVFDYVEDFAKGGEPHWEEFLLVAAARRDFYLYEQHSSATEAPLKESDLPAKTDAIEGIEWLPRIVVKADAFLKGKLPHEIMYGCGGDRRFLKEADVHLGDFLRIVWAAKGDARRVLKFIGK